MTHIPESAKVNTDNARMNVRQLPNTEYCSQILKDFFAYRSLGDSDCSYEQIQTHIPRQCDEKC